MSKRELINLLRDLEDKKSQQGLSPKEEQDYAEVVDVLAKLEINNFESNLSNNQQENKDKEEIVEKNNEIELNNQELSSQKLSRERMNKQAQEKRLDVIEAHVKQLKCKPKIECGELTRANFKMWKFKIFYYCR